MKYSALKVKQKGQSLLWVLGFLATMAVTFAGVYSVGQTTSEKQKIVNAADAAAYTGGMVEARALNLTAYANRAEIANEVFVAQMVSLQSWVDYMKETIGSFRNVSQIAQFIPYVGLIFRAIDRILQVVERGLGTIASTLQGGVPASIGLVEVYYGVMNAATSVIFGNAGAVNMAFATQSAAEAVLAANIANQDGKIDTAPIAIHTTELKILNGGKWRQAFHKYDRSSYGSASDGRRNAAEILKISRDEFSTERKGTTGIWGFLWGNDNFGACPVGEIGASKDGPTELKEYDKWEAQDTSEYYIATGFRCRKRGVAYGWGRSTAHESQTSGARKIDPHRSAGSRAYNNVKKNGNWSGVKSLWDVSRDSSDYPVDTFKQDDEKLTFAIAVAKSKVNIKNNESLNFMNRDAPSKLGSPVLKSDFLNGQISAKAEAKIFFSRPVNNNNDFTATRLFRGDRHKELANLYNPYWQVRLRTTSNLTDVAIYGSNIPLALFAQ
jgi:hypothetical protein